MTLSGERFGKVAVLLGGTSAEREISLLSGNAVLAALREEGVDAHAFDPAQRSLFELEREKFDRVFIALHGRHGEDGTVQGALQLMRIPYTGSGVLASALCLDKWRTKLIWRAVGIPVPRDEMVNSASSWPQVAANLRLPLIIKPVHEGSTLGLTKVESVADLPAAYTLAARYDTAVMAEEFIEGQELTASILGDRVLPLIRIEAPGGKYDYQNKYFSEQTKYHCPCGIRADLESRIQEVALQAFRVLGCTGWGRADLILKADGSFFFLEMNTSPGMTGHSLVPMAARQAGLSFGQLVLQILESARVE
ncbi:MAG TPA: D-alanine--D-alanine ligase [Burkholderiales bacterium]|nr:D-alanine--D-alanine ligase [Burkholderiales bacterium]